MATLLLISATAAFAVTQVLGKEDAPGQIKNQSTTEVDVGRVGEVKPGQIEVNNKGKKIEINTDQNTEIIEKPSGKKLNAGQLKKNDQVGVIATSSANASKSAKLILVKPATSSAAVEKKRRAVYGLVREINGNIFTISHPIKDRPRYKVQVVETTVIKIKGITSPNISDIKVGDRVAAVGNWSDDILVAKRLHVIPGKATGLLQRIATSPATFPATFSASPSATGLP